MPGQRQASCMRPARFQDLLVAAVNHDGQMKAVTYTDARITRSLYGLVLSGPVNADVQIAARSALGDDYSLPEHVVTGTEHPYLATTEREPMREVPPVHLEGVEEYLAALTVDMAAQEIASMSLYHLRDKRGAIKYGFTVNFHDGSAIFCYITESHET